MYFKPFIDEFGIHIPTYEDILEDLLNTARLIFGEDIYLDHDSQDYQFISALAIKMNDVNELAVMCYNNRSPQFAVGNALDSLVKINGIKRNTSEKSKVTVKLTGAANTTINNGLVSDVRGTMWELPDVVVLDISGTAYVTATCKVYGPVIALAGDITTIEKPTLGWTSVTNETAAVLGTNVESNSMLRAKQALSVARPSLTLFEQTKGSVLELVGVTRLNAIDNDTSSVDSNGIPSHSISLVVEGGISYDIAETIYKNKGPGGGTYGSETVVVSVNEFGGTIPIKFSRPSYIYPDIKITLKALDGYGPATEEAIMTSVVSYLNSIKIGSVLYASNLWSVVLSNQDLKSPLFSVTSILQARHGQTLSGNDIQALYNEAIAANASYITIQVV